MLFYRFHFATHTSWQGFSVLLGTHYMNKVAFWSFSPWSHGLSNNLSSRLRMVVTILIFIFRRFLRFMGSHNMLRWQSLGPVCTECKVWDHHREVREEIMIHHPRSVVHTYINTANQLRLFWLEVTPYQSIGVFEFHFVMSVMFGTQHFFLAF